MDLSGLLGARAVWGAMAMLGLTLTGCAEGSGPTSAMSLQPVVQAAAASLELTATATPGALRPYVPTNTSTPTNTSIPTTTPTTAPPATLTPVPTATTVVTPMPAPTITPVPTSIATAEPTTIPLPPALPAADPGTLLNGISFSDIAVLPTDVVANIQSIYRHGQELGRNPQAFSKLGDSLVLTDHYLTRFDNGPYNLGPFAALQPTVDYFAGSFARYGVAAKVGLYADFATRPGLANEKWCSSEEHMMACEFRLHNPSIMLIRVGTNDVIAASAFETALHKIVEYAVANGVIPVLGTKADRFEGDNRNNDIIRKVAADYKIPLWDFDLVAGTLPDRGLSGDHAHLSVYKHDDYTDPVSLQTGYPVSDLSALVVLDAVRAAATTP